MKLPNTDQLATFVERASGNIKVYSGEETKKKILKNIKKIALDQGFIKKDISTVKSLLVALENWNSKGEVYPQHMSNLTNFLKENKKKNF